ncbi:MAG: DsrE family protein [Gammaproteobacteria bacterium]|jgi:tRNA 2-thiouridine synthesizing protein D|nr:DsrE family protein [Gammaproteobacteria bacterium]MBU2224867.1 DsrE family protein [Gammaproteobacteria bacterium]MBU2278189.1 DsrE family protein [Gammaproteobacteria bacterium]MBU2428669.1 DsrE family protein [Gammaproteobacteria bacterium]
MAVFALYVQSNTFASPTLASVLRFAKAALAEQHQIDHLFFYQDAVQAIIADIDLPADEPDMAAAVVSLCQQHNIPLLYCVTAAEKRGFACAAKPARAGFIAAGLAEFAMRLDVVDQVIQF